MKKVRWGLLSTANINRRLIPAIKSSARGELVAVASRNLDKAKAYASEWDIQMAFGSYQELLESGFVDAVYIGLPNHLHAEWSQRAMRAGVHVLCEKPFALSVEEADAMIAAHEQHQRVLAEAFMYRHHPQTKIAGDLVRSGKLGDIHLIRAVFSFSLRNRGNIRLVPEYGGGSLWDVGVYPVSFAQFILAGPPDWVQGIQFTGESGVDETFTGQMHYAGGSTAQISCSIRTPLYTHAEVLGSEGRLVLNRPFVGQEEAERRLMFYPASGEPEEIPVPEQALYSGEVEDMHAAILDGKPSYVTLAETRNHILTVLALYKSAQQHSIVFL